ncbi:MAG: hypothetical protein QHI48_12530 [Bacteroidota bacterium]|nr:hypothetical protein [Bacteroidota bacterium]
MSPTSPTATPTTVPRCLWGTEGYTVQIQVQYVSQTSPDVVSATPTWAKRITVTVTSAYSDFPLTMTHVVTY